jgi:hypothetical protein
MSSFSLLRSLSSDTQSTPPKRRINKRFSFHQKQHQGVKEPALGTSSMERDKKAKTNLNRRWSSLKQYQTTTLSQQSLATGNSSSSTGTPLLNAGDASARGAIGAGDVKKKWEVIEHYRETMSGKETISSSLLAVSGSTLLGPVQSRLFNPFSSALSLSLSPFAR